MKTAEIDRLASEFKAQSLRFEKHQNEARSEQQELEAALESEKSNLRTLEERHTELELQHEELNEKTRTQITGLEKDLERLRADYAKLGNEKTELKARAEKEIESLETQLRGLRNEKDELEFKHEELEETHSKAVSAAETKIAEYEALKASLEEALKNERLQTAQLKEQCVNLDRELTLKVLALEQLHIEAQKQAQQITALNSNLENLTAARESLIAELEAQKNISGDLQARAKKSQEEFARERNETAQEKKKLEAALAEEHVKLEHEKNEFLNAQKTWADFKTQTVKKAEETQKQLEGLAHQKQSLETHLTSLKLEHDKHPAKVQG